MKIKFAEAAQFQGNTMLALTKLKEIRDLAKIKSRDVQDLQITWLHCYLKTHLAKARLNMLNGESSIENALGKFFRTQSLAELVKFDNAAEFNSRRDLHRTHQLLHGQFCQYLCEAFLGAFSNSSDYFEEFKSDERKYRQLSEYLKYSPK